MKCPSCKSELIFSGEAKFAYQEGIDLDLKAYAKSFYFCNNFKCTASGEDDVKKRTVLIEKEKKCDPLKKRIFWNEYGELYGLCQNIKFIDDNNSPFGTHSRKINVEIYKKDENFLFLNVWFYKFMIEYKYKSNEDGCIIKRTPKIIVLKKIEFWNFKYNDYVYYVSWIRMLKFKLTNFYGEKRSFNRNINTDNFNKNSFQKILKTYKLTNYHNRVYDYLLIWYLNVFEKSFFHFVKSQELKYKHKNNI